MVDAKIFYLHTKRSIAVGSGDRASVWPVTPAGEADQGDTTTVGKKDAAQAVKTPGEFESGPRQNDHETRKCICRHRRSVTDKGYHSGEVLMKMQGAHSTKTYIPGEETRRVRRHWVLPKALSSSESRSKCHRGG